MHFKENENMIYAKFGFDIGSISDSINCWIFEWGFQC